MVNFQNKTFCIDSNIFIYYFQQEKVFGPYAKAVFELLQSGDSVGVTSIVTLTELLSFDLSSKQLKDLRHDLLEIPNLTFYDMDQDVAVEAARLRRVYGVRTPDAIQLATGICYDADFFVTNDNQLKRIKEITVFPLSNVSI